MKFKKILAGVLSAAMVMTSVSVTDWSVDNVQAAGPVNLAIGGRATATDQEGPFPASKAIDGDTSHASRWSTNNNRKTETLTVTLKDGVVHPVKRVKVTFEDREQNTPGGQTNITGYKIMAKNASGVYEQVYIKQQGVQQVEDITLPNTVNTNELQLVILSIQSSGYQNNGVYEFEVYADETLEQRPNVNHMRTATISVSSTEADTLPKERLNDGVQTTGRTSAEITQGRSNRWASGATENTAAWVNAAFAKTTTVQEVVVNFWRDADPLYTQVSGFTIEYVDENNVTKSVPVKNTLVNEFLNNAAKRGYEDIVTYRFKTPVKMKSMKIKDFTVKSCQYNNISIEEIEVYSNDRSAVADVERTPDKNHMLNAAVSASSTETTDGRFRADKVKDGIKDVNTNRWSSAENRYQNEWVKAVLPKYTEIKEIKFYLFTRSVAPMPSNIKSFNIVYKGTDGASHTIPVTNKTQEGGYSKFIQFVLPEPIIAKELEIKNFVVTGNQYTNVSINEIELYSNAQAVVHTLETVAASIEGGEIAADVTTLELPKVPEGFTVEFNGADFEQIVDRTLKVNHPLVDKDVKISYNVKQNGTDKVLNTGDLVYKVKGTKTQATGKNAKPKVIPEIQEWYSESTERVSVNDLTKVVYNDPSLEKVVQEFVKDYEEFTGKKLTAVQGTVDEANAFCFKKNNTYDYLGTEGYAMDIQANKVLVESSTVTGNMYAMQTILQMYKENATGYVIGQMRDYPRYKVRGFVFDVARKPVSLGMLKDVTRTMRYYKMNDFQVHLNDNYIFLEHYFDQKNPEKAYEAFRLESKQKNSAGVGPTATDYYMTKAEFKQFIHDERAVGMNIVPEIDVPAHGLSFTKVWPEVGVQNAYNPRIGRRSLIDHFDLTNQKAIDRIKTIFDEYTSKGDNVFDANTVIHIGADEFEYNKKAYRDFVNQIVPYVKSTNKVRIWGGLTWIDDGKTQIIPEAVKDVQINLWSSDWSDGMDMYKMGYELINTIDDFGYLVPNGAGQRGIYKDFLDLNRVFNQFEPNMVRIRNKSYVPVPSGDDQMLGAAYALWNDNIDKSACGLTESDMFDCFFDALPFYAEKTWAATGKEKGSAQALTALSQSKGIGPNVNPHYVEKHVGTTYESYSFKDQKDGSGNQRDLKALNGAEIKGGALHLGDQVSYAETPLQKIGNGNALSFDVTLDKAATVGDILFEADAAYGTHDIRIVEGNKLGFTRELYEYSFNYQLPVGKKVNLKFVTAKQKTELYVDGAYVGAAVGRFVHNGMVKKTGIPHSTFALPLQRIGSAKNALACQIDNVLVSTADPYNKASWTLSTNSETTQGGGSVEGTVRMAFDNIGISRWHSNWNGATDKVMSDNGTAGNKSEIWAQAIFDQGYEIDTIKFTPRRDRTGTGCVTKADLYIQKTANGPFEKIITDATFAPDITTKAFQFEKQVVYGFKFVAKQSNDGWVTVSEFDIEKTMDSEPVYTVTVNGGTITTGTATVEEGVAVTVKANAPETGKKFAYWSMDNKPVCYAETYTLTVYNDVTLTAVYVQAADTVAPTASMFCTATYNAATHLIKFTAKRSLPVGATNVEHGIILTNQATWEAKFKNNPDAFALDSNGNKASGTILKTGTTTGLLGNYSVSVRCTKPNTWYAKGYVKYTYNNKDFVVYSDVTSYTVQ